MRSISEVIAILGEWSFYAWLGFSAYVIWDIRHHLSGIMYGSFAKYTKSSRKKANAATKEQPLWRRITMTYIGDYVSKRLRKPYIMYMVFKAVIDTWVILGVLLVAALFIVDVPYIQEIWSINIVGLVAFAVILLLLYNPNTRQTRFIDFMY